MNSLTKQVLMSIRPQFAIPVVNGTKTIELRRKFPTDIVEGTKVVVYASSPISKIIGEVRIKSVVELPIKELWNYASIDAMISYEMFQEYFKGCKVGYAINLGQSLKYDEPLRLDKILGKSNPRPPQSYMYVEGVEL